METVEELTTEAEKLFGKTVQVLPPGPQSWVSPSWEIYDDEHGITYIRTWPSPFKDMNYPLTGLVREHGGWTLAAPEGATHLRRPKETARG